MVGWFDSPLSLAQTPDFLWARQAGGVGNDFAYSVAVDGAGNAYLTGSFQGTAAFGCTILTNGGCFVAKLDTSGNFLWARQAGGSVGGNSGFSVAVDGAGNVYLAGSYQGTATFGATTLSGDHNNQYNFYYDNAFVAKLDAGGNFLWAKKAGSSGGDVATSLVVDGAGNVYLAGYFYGTATIGTTTLTNSGIYSDVFVAKLDASGNFLWAKQAGGNYNDYANSVAADGAGNVYLAGSFRSIATFGTTTLTNSSTSYADAFVAKLDASGNFLWAKQAGGNDNDSANSVAVDGAGNVYLAGYYSGGVTFGTITLGGSIDYLYAFVAKLDPNGNFLWAKGVGSNGVDPANSVAVDGTGNVYLAGKFYNNGMPTFGTITLTNINTTYSGDVFVAKLDSRGNFLWAKLAGGVGEDSGNSIAVDGAGNVYLAGYFSGTATFGGIPLPSSDGYHIDAFVTKLGMLSTPPVITSAPKITATLGQDFSYQITANNAPTSFNATNVPAGLSVNTTNGLISGIPTAVGTSTIMLAAANGIGTGTASLTVTIVQALDFLWARQAGGSGDDVANSVVTDRAGNIYLAGSFRGPAILGATALTNSGYYDAFVANLDGAGNFLWARQAGGSPTYSYADSAYSVVVDGAGKAYLAGNFGGIAGFGSTTLTNSGGFDAFVAKLGIPTTAPVITALSPSTNAVGGASAMFSVVATNATGVQWLFNGVPISNQTNGTLNLGGLRRTNSGAYSVVVTGAGGSVTSAPALLKVQVPQQLQTPQKQSNGQIQLTFNDRDGGFLTANDLPYFELHVSTNVLFTNWLTFSYTNGLSLSNGLLLFNDMDATNQQRRFYRIIER